MGNEAIGQNAIKAKGRAIFTLTKNRENKIGNRFSSLEKGHRRALRHSGNFAGRELDRPCKLEDKFIEKEMMCRYR